MTFILALVFLTAAAYLLHVIWQDDRGHSFTHRQPPRGEYLFGGDPWSLT
ncbi:hypothetical protein ACFSBG_06790 [Georgenia yuyongxinii]|nr:hypothetical protein [Georgenia yuyongxinii]